MKLSTTKMLWVGHRAPTPPTGGEAGGLVANVTPRECSVIRTAFASPRRRQRQRRDHPRTPAAPGAQDRGSSYAVVVGDQLVLSIKSGCEAIVIIGPVKRRAECPLPDSR